MATHSSILAWKISWTEETCGLQSMGSQRVRHDWAHNARASECFNYILLVTFKGHFWASLVAQLVKNSPAMQETWLQSLGWEDPLENVKATHSSILAWWITWAEEPDKLQSMGSQRIRHNLVTKPLINYEYLILIWLYISSYFNFIILCPMTRSNDIERRTILHFLM